MTDRLLSPSPSLLLLLLTFPTPFFTPPYFFLPLFKPRESPRVVEGVAEAQGDNNDKKPITTRCNVQHRLAIKQRAHRIFLFLVSSAQLPATMSDEEKSGERPISCVSTLSFPYNQLDYIPHADFCEQDDRAVLLRPAQRRVLDRRQTRQVIHDR